MGLVAVGVTRAGSVRLADPEAPASDIRSAPLVITPQAAFGYRRLDFLLSWRASRLAEARTIVVECDGHRFHERTEDQARRDRQRDRDIQRAGMMVFRFTGAEIWEDAIACAEEGVRCVMATRGQLNGREPVGCYPRATLAVAPDGR